MSRKRPKLKIEALQNNLIYFFIIPDILLPYLILIGLKIILMGTCLGEAKKQRQQERTLLQPDQVYIDESSYSAIKLRVVSQSNMNDDVHKNIVALLWRDKKGHINRINRGTGFLISKNLVLTCAHNLYHLQKRVDDSLFQIYPKQCGPLGKFYKIEKAFVPQQYVQNPISCLVMYDYSLLKLTEDVQSDNFLPLKYDFQNKQQDLAIYGYPDQKYENTGSQNIESVQQWGMNMNNGIVQVREAKGQILYSISTLKGQSGSPIIQIEGGRLSIVGIHKGVLKITQDAETVVVNNGTLITKEVFRTLKQQAIKMGVEMLTESIKQDKNVKKDTQSLKGIQQNVVLKQQHSFIHQQLQNYLQIMARKPSAQTYYQIIKLIKKMSRSEYRFMIRQMEKKFANNEISLYCWAVVQQYAEITILNQKMREMGDTTKETA